MKRIFIKRLLVISMFCIFGISRVECADSPDQNLQIKNIFRSSPSLPATLKRVLILPLACETKPVDLTGGAEILNPVLQAELVKTKKFEVVAASSGTLQNLTGKLTWNGAEILPSDFFDSLRRFYGCDAVLFCQLTVFRAYEPLAVGWRLKLVDAQTQKII
jgi:hypothetical protein